MTINVDLSQITPSTDGKYYEAFPAGDALVNFGNAALGGTYTNDTITVTTDGTYSFGTKTQAAPMLHDIGDTVYENGVVNTDNASISDGATIPDDPINTIYEQLASNLIAKRTGLRHAAATMHYQANSGDGADWIGKPYAGKRNTSGFGGYDSTPQADKLYVSWFFKPQYEVSGYGECAITNVVGTFATKNGRFAEDLIVTNAGGAGVSYMKLIEVFNDGVDKIAYEASRSAVVPNGVGSDELIGASIEGAISGATADFDPATYILSFGGSSKFIRVWDNEAGDSGTGPEPDIGARISWTNSQLTTGGSIDNTNTILNPDEWNQLEILVDLSTLNTKRWVNGQLLTNYTITGITRSPLSSVNNEGNPVNALLGWDGKQTKHSPEFGEIYQDLTPQRVVIGDAATWSACTRREPQRATAWTDTSATVARNDGEVTGSKWIYVCDATGEPVTSTGVSLP